MEEIDFHDARIAAGNGDLSTVEAWLSQGGDINSDGNDLGRSSTLLAAAIVGSQTQICEYLLARGARTATTKPKPSSSEWQRDGEKEGSCLANNKKRFLT